MTNYVSAQKAQFHTEGADHLSQLIESNYSTLDLRFSAKVDLLVYVYDAIVTVVFPYLGRHYVEFMLMLCGFYYAELSGKMIREEKKSGKKGFLINQLTLSSVMSRRRSIWGKYSEKKCNEENSPSTRGPTSSLRLYTRRKTCAHILYVLHWLITFPFLTAFLFPSLVSLYVLGSNVQSMWEFGSRDESTNNSMGDPISQSTVGSLSMGRRESLRLMHGVTEFEIKRNFLDTNHPSTPLHDGTMSTTVQRFTPYSEWFPDLGMVLDSPAKKLWEVWDYYKVSGVDFSHTRIGSSVSHDQFLTDPVCVPSWTAVWNPFSHRNPLVRYIQLFTENASFYCDTAQRILFNMVLAYMVSVIYVWVMCVLGALAFAYAFDCTFSILRGVVAMGKDMIALFSFLLWDFVSFSSYICSNGIRLLFCGNAATGEPVSVWCKHEWQNDLISENGSESGDDVVPIRSSKAASSSFEGKKRISDSQVVSGRRFARFREGFESHSFAPAHEFGGVQKHYGRKVVFYFVMICLFVHEHTFLLETELLGGSQVAAENYRLRLEKLTSQIFRGQLADQDAELKRASNDAGTNYNPQSGGGALGLAVVGSHGNLIEGNNTIGKNDVGEPGSSAKPSPFWESKDRTRDDVLLFSVAHEKAVDLLEPDRELNYLRIDMIPDVGTAHNNIGTAGHRLPDANHPAMLKSGSNIRSKLNTKRMSRRPEQRVKLHISSKFQNAVGNFIFYDPRSSTWRAKADDGTLILALSDIHANAGELSTKRVPSSMEDYSQSDQTEWVGTMKISNERYEPVQLGKVPDEYPRYETYLTVEDTKRKSASAECKCGFQLYAPSCK